MRYTARLKYLKMTPRKVRLLASMLKGMPVNEAEAQLMLNPKRAAKPLLKLLRSAAANAKNNLKQDPAKLFIESIRVDQGPMLKRFMPRARGSASPIQKKMSHVSILLKESETAAKPRFSITVSKKVKAKKLKEAVKKEKRAEEQYQKPIQEKPGFFKRFFRRKSV